MAIFGNFKGTTKSEFQIGKTSGTKISSGTIPSSDLTTGDIYLDASNTSLQVYTGSAWQNIGSALPELNVDSGTLFVDSSNDTVSVGSTSSNEKLFVNGNLRLGTNPSLQFSGAYLDLRHSNGSATQIRVRDNSSGSDPILKVYNANNTSEVFKVQGANVRIHDAYNMPTADGTANQILQTDGSGTLSFVDNSATPGGSDTQIQFNDSGSFGGHANLTYDSSTETLGTTNLSVTNFTYSVLSEDYGSIGETTTVTKDYGDITEEASGDFLNDVVEDTTPQLGGSLDVNGQSIVSVSNGDITIAPNGTGSIVLDGLSWPQADGSANQVLQTDGAGNLSFVTISGGGGGGLSNIVEDTTPQLGGNLDAQSNNITGVDTLRINENGTGLRMTNVGAFDNSGGDFRIFANGNLILSTDGDSGTAVTFDQNTKDATFQGNVTVNNAYTLPSADGTAGQFLQTDGSGGVTFSNAFTDLSITGTATYNTVEFQNSNIMKFNQMYTGASTGSYFTNGEYQKVVTIIPDGASQNYQVVGRITAQNANETHTVYFNAALRSNTLPNLDWTITYDEEYNGNRYIDPQLWTKQTTTAGFIFAFKTLSTIYGTVTVDMEVIPRISSQKDNVTVNTVQNSEQASIDTGYTANDMTKVFSKKGQEFTIGGAYKLPTADGSANQVLTTDGSGTLSFTTITDTPSTVYALSGTDIDPANGGIQTKTVAANTTFTESLSSGESVVLHLTAGASYTITWPTTTWVTSSGNTAPTLTADDVLVFWKVGSTLYGAYTGSSA